MLTSIWLRMEAKNILWFYFLSGCANWGRRASICGRSWPSVDQSLCWALARIYFLSFSCSALYHGRAHTCRLYFLLRGLLALVILGGPHKRLEHGRREKPKISLCLTRAASLAVAGHPLSPQLPLDRQVLSSSGLSPPVRLCWNYLHIWTSSIGESPTCCICWSLGCYLIPVWHLFHVQSDFCFPGWLPQIKIPIVKQRGNLRVIICCITYFKVPDLSLSSRLGLFVTWLSIWMRWAVGLVLIWPSCTLIYYSGPKGLTIILKQNHSSNTRISSLLSSACLDTLHEKLINFQG